MFYVVFVRVCLNYIGKNIQGSIKSNLKTCITICIDVCTYKISVNRQSFWPTTSKALFSFYYRLTLLLWWTYVYLSRDWHSFLLNSFDVEWKTSMLFVNFGGKLFILEFLRIFYPPKIYARLWFFVLIRCYCWMESH